MIALGEAARPPVGALGDRLEFRQRDTTTDDSGGAVTTFVPIATLWGRVRQLAARRIEAADGRQASITHSVVLRYRTDVSPGDRFVYRGRTLEVVGAADLNGRRAYLSCTCLETSVTG